MKRHNNRRREQRHNKSYEYALELRCQAAAQLLNMGEDEEAGAYEPYYMQQGLAGPFGPARFTAQYQPHQFGLAAGFTPTDGGLSGIDMAAAAAAAAAITAGQEQQYGQDEYEQYEQDGMPAQEQQFPEQGLSGMLSRWAALDCPPAVSPEEGPEDGSGSAGGAHSEGTTATAGPGQHASPNVSPDEAAVAAAAAAATAAVGASGTPTSRRSGPRRVSAHRALEALRTMNSAYSTESDWDAECEEGATPTAWQQRRQGQAGGARLQGSRLKSSGRISAPGVSLAPAEVVPHLGHLLPAHLQDGTPRAGQGAQGFRGGLSHLNPTNSMQQQSQWGGEYGDMQGWEASLAAHLQAQQDAPQQQQQWGSAYDGSCGGTVAGSGGGASYDNNYVTGQHMGHMSSGGGASGPMQQQPGLGMQNSTPAALCYNSRSNSPAISTGGTGPGMAAAGPGPSLLGPGPRSAGGMQTDGLQGNSLHPQWSLPAQSAPAQDYYPAGNEDGPMQGADQMQQQCTDAGQLLLSMQQAYQGGDGRGFGSMQPHELQQVLEGLLPGAMCSAGQPAAAEVPMSCADVPGMAPAPAGYADSPACGAPMGSQALGGTHMNGMEHCSPTEVSPEAYNPHDGVSTGAEGTYQQSMMQPSSQGMGFDVNVNSRPLSPQSSMTAAAAAAAAAIVRGGFVAAVARQRSRNMGCNAGMQDMQQLLAQDSSAAALMQAKQQQCMGYDMPCGDQQAASYAAAAAATAVRHASSSPDSSFGGAAGGVMVGPAGMGLQQLRTDSQGTSVLREELAGVSLGSEHWQPQMQASDMHMTDAADMHQHSMQYDPQHAQQVSCKQSGSPLEGSHAANPGYGMDLQHAAAGIPCGDTSPVGEFDSVDTAAAAATFEAQLAACRGNKQSQEAVFKAWLDALLPGVDEQQLQQGQQAMPQAPMQHNQMSPASASPSQQGGPYQDDLGEPGCQQQHQADAVEGFPLEEAAVDVDTAAVALQLAAQRAAEGEGNDSINAEEDFRELLDLLLDA